MATRMLTLPEVPGTAEIVKLAEQIGESVDRLGEGQESAYVLLALALVLLIEVQSCGVAISDESRDLEAALRALVAAYLRFAVAQAGLASAPPAVH